MNNSVQPGDVRTVTAGATAAAGDVMVVGNQLAVAAVNINNGATGPAAFAGVFTVPKGSTGAIGHGADVMWDVSASEFIADAAGATGDVRHAAVAAAAAGDGDTTMQVQLANRIGTVV